MNVLGLTPRQLVRACRHMQDEFTGLAQTLVLSPLLFFGELMSASAMQRRAYQLRDHGLLDEPEVLRQALVDLEEAEEVLEPHIAARRKVGDISRSDYLGPYCAYPPAENSDEAVEQRAAWRLRNAGVSEAEWLGESCPGAVESPRHPAPGHPNPSSADLPAAHHRAADGEGPAADCAIRSDAPAGHPIPHDTDDLLLAASVQLRLFRAGGVTDEWRRGYLKQLIYELESRADELGGRSDIAVWLVPAVTDVLAEHYFRASALACDCGEAEGLGPYEWREHVAPILTERVAEALPWFGK